MLAQENDRVIQSLDKIAVPTLVLVGANDTNFLAATDYMAAKIKGVDQGGHPRRGPCSQPAPARAFQSGGRGVPRQAAGSLRRRPWASELQSSASARWVDMSAAWLAHTGEDVTLIDFWPENIEAIRSRGLELDGVTPEEKFTVTKAKTMHLTEMEALSRQKPIDIAFVSMKSYDTEWATALIKQYLAPDGYVVSLQNCLNEERIAEQSSAGARPWAWSPR